uniref:Galanin domain-containing protein n=1 Tax=Gopherus evgoodei TaxID=1825980 RepID=A0A8C4WGC9_9SAUR
MGTPAVLCISLILWGLLGECAGIPLMLKDKRGWTLNSAGYLLGPHAHRPLMDKGALAGKREAAEEPVQLEVEFDGESLAPNPLRAPLFTPLTCPALLQVPPCAPRLSAASRPCWISSPPCVFQSWGPRIVCPSPMPPGSPSPLSPHQSACARSPPSR